MHRLRTAGALTLGLILVAAPAHAGGHGSPGTPGTPVTLATGLVTPLSAAVDLDGTVYVAQNFAGILTSVDRRGRVGTVTTSAPGVELGGLSALGGQGVFTETLPEGGALLRGVDRRGQIRTIADLGAAEVAQNPDGGRSSGFLTISPECAASFPAQFPATTPSEVFSHPYAAISVLGYTAVADAGANTVWLVDRKGSVRPLAVLPLQPSVLPDELAGALGVPECAFGQPYSFEPVPTDVELGVDGWLYVTTLPGGPEDPSAGARGSVYKINPWTGQTVLVATGFAGAVDLAVDLRGNVFVAELLADRISVVKKGSSTPEAFVSVPSPGVVEWTPGALYATTNVFASFPAGPEADLEQQLAAAPPAPDGQLVRIPLR